MRRVAVQMVLARAAVGAAIALATLTSPEMLLLAPLWLLAVRFPALLVLWPLLAYGPRRLRRPGRRPGAALPAGVAAPGALRALVDEEAAALGMLAPEARVAAGREIHLHRGVLCVGLFALAEHTPEQLRVAVDAALLEGEDANVARLRARRGRLRVLQSRAAAHPRVSLPWAWAVRGADRLAASAVDRHVRRGLLRLEAQRGLTTAREHATTHAARRARFETYWRGWVTPALDAGFHPPLLDGWRDWLALPPDGDRLPLPPDLEASVLAAVAPDRADALLPLAWERYGEAVIVPYALANAPGDVAEMTLADLPLLAAAAAGPARLDALTMALIAALASRGWSVAAVPGQPTMLRADGGGFAPFDLLWALAEDPRCAEEWSEFATAAGIADLPLAPARTGDALRALLEAPAAIPSRVELTMALSPQRRRLLRREIAAGTVGVLLILATMALLSLAGARLFAATVGLGNCLYLALRLRGLLRTARARGRVVIDAEGVTIEHPALLRRPFVLAREKVRTVVLDLGPERDERLGRRVSLPVTVSAWDQQRPWLWVEGRPSLVPIVAVDRERPNLAIVLTEPAAGPELRRRMPMRRNAIGGLLLAVAASPADARALGEFGFSPELTPDDGQVLREAYDGPIGTSYRRASSSA